MNDDIEQRRRNVRVCELLTDSYEAYSRGDNAASGQAAADAVECDAQAYVVITGAMVIGEVPHPEKDWTAWIAYVEAQRDGLAQAEAGGEP